MDISKYIIAVVALLFVLSLIGIVSLLLKKYAGGFAGMPKVRSDRIKIIEVRQVDATRKLILFTVDEVEQLILLAANNAGGNVALGKHESLTRQTVEIENTDKSE